MANLKNITELPVAKSAEGLNLIVNDDGAAKQIAASAVGAQADFAVTDENSPAFIRNKPVVAQADFAVTDENSPAFIKNKPTVTKELVYEWNFSIDDDVYQIAENVDDDLMWMAKPEYGNGFEIVFCTYARIWDNDSGEYNMHPDETITIYCTSNNSVSLIGRSGSAGGIEVYGDAYSEPWYDDLQTTSYAGVSWNIYLNKHLDPDTGDAVPVDHGGFLGIASDESPIKSVQIYKITK